MDSKWFIAANLQVLCLCAAAGFYVFFPAHFSHCSHTQQEVKSVEVLWTNVTVVGLDFSQRNSLQHGGFKIPASNLGIEQYNSCH